LVINLEALKRDWRAKATARGIDVRHGATSYQVVHIQAARAKASHRRRAAKQVRAQAAAHPHRWLNENGAFDWERVTVQCSRYWWAIGDFWSQEDGREDSVVLRPTEIVAIYNLYQKMERPEMRFLRWFSIRC
jgi:hypothetical protein